jgi:hypothetical protein
VRLPDAGWLPEGGTIAELTFDVRTSRVALGVRDSARPALVVLDEDLTVLGTTSDGDAAELAELDWLGFCGPDRLITKTGWGAMGSWRLGGGRITLQARTELVHRDGQPSRAGSGALPPYIWVRPQEALGQVAVGGDFNPSREPRLLDAATLGRVDSPWMRPGGRWTVSDDGYHAAGWDDRGVVELHDLRLATLRRLATEPLAKAHPSDARLLAGVGGLELPPPAAEVASLLRACVEYRFEVPADTRGLGGW